MLEPNNDTLLSEIRTRLVNTLGPEKIFLFGSRAKGNANHSSDYDIAIILPVEKSEKMNLMDVAHNALWGISASVDIVILSPSELTEMSEVKNTLPSILLDQGIEIYAA